MRNLRTVWNVSALVWIAVLLLRSSHAGELETKTMRSEFVDREVKINILLPDDYASQKDQRYPTIYLLHGFGGDYGEWDRIGIVEEAKGLKAILVMPEGDRSFYANNHTDAKERWEDHITQEVVNFVDSNYRTVAGASSRGISGLSMGGYGALLLGLRHPKTFRSIASHSGALGAPHPIGHERVDTRFEEIFGPVDSEHRKAHDLARLARALPRGDVPDIYIDCGSQDFLLESNRKYVALLAKLAIPYEYREVPGAHDFGYWRRNVRYSLEHQLQALEAARAAEPDAADLSLTGLWNVTATFQGSERSSTIDILHEGVKVTAKAHLQDSTLDLEKGSFENGKLSLERKFERDGQTGVIRIEADLENEKLVGRWRILSEDGQEFLNESWAAVPVKPLARRKPKVAKISLTGLWNVTAELEGNETSSTIDLVHNGEKVTGKAAWDTGGVDLDSGSFKDGKLVLKAKFERDGQTGVLRIDAALEEGKLVGRWKVFSEDGQEFLDEIWSAVPTKPLSKGEPKKETPQEAASPIAAVAGEWSLTIQLFDQEIDYGLRLSVDGGAAKAVIVSPRSGDHPCRTVSLKDGVLRWEIDRDYDNGKITFVYEGKLTDGKLAGEVFARTDQGDLSGTWSGVRKAQAREEL